MYTGCSASSPPSRRASLLQLMAGVTYNAICRRHRCPTCRRRAGSSSSLRGPAYSFCLAYGVFVDVFVCMPVALNRRQFMVPCRRYRCPSPLPSSSRTCQSGIGLSGRMPSSLRGPACGSCLAYGACIDIFACMPVAIHRQRCIVPCRRDRCPRSLPSASRTCESGTGLSGRMLSSLRGPTCCSCLAYGVFACMPVAIHRQRCIVS